MSIIKKEISIPLDQEQEIKGNLSYREQSKRLVIFAHGSGSSRFSKRNNFVADQLNAADFSTLLFDLLTMQEDAVDQYTREFRFNIPLLADRLIAVTQWVLTQKNLPNSIGYFGASTGAAAALIAAAMKPEHIRAIVSRGGRPDLAESYLSQVRAPTLLLVGEQDEEVIKLNQKAYDQLTSPKELIIIPGATHLFEEEGTLEAVTQQSIIWFDKYF